MVTPQILRFSVPSFFDVLRSIINAVICPTIELQSVFGNQLPLVMPRWGDFDGKGAKPANGAV